MLGLYVCIGRARSKRFEIPKEAVSIGSDASNDLVLRDGRVEPFHCRLIFSRDRWFLAAPGEGALEPSPLEDGTELTVGDYRVVLAIEPLARDPVERSLISQIAAGDAASRLVYADWLESRGDAARAEFVRAQEAIAAIDPVDVVARAEFRLEGGPLRELAAKLDLDWRRAVGRPAVEGCRRTSREQPCRMDWGTLGPTARPDVRRCAACGDDVHYAPTMYDARAHMRGGRRVVVDLAERRSDGDLRL